MMAIQKDTREDLLRDATQYARRFEIRIPRHRADKPTNSPAWQSNLERMVPSAEVLFVGFRASQVDAPGGWSVYFGEDPVLQFNAKGQLRRLYFADVKYAASQGRLEALTRGQEGGRVSLLRTELGADAQRKLLEECRCLMTAAAEMLRVADRNVVRQVPPDDSDLLTQALRNIEVASSKLEIAQTANA